MMRMSAGRTGHRISVMAGALSARPGHGTVLQWCISHKFYLDCPIVKRFKPQHRLACDIRGSPSEGCSSSDWCSYLPAIAAHMHFKHSDSSALHQLRVAEVTI